MLTNFVGATFVDMEAPHHDSNEAEIVSLLTEIQLPLLLYVRSLLPGDPSARDVAQQANAKIWQLRDEFESGTNFKAWAFSIARFEVLSYRKQQARDARFVFSSELEELISDEISVGTGELELQSEALRECMQSLRERDRELILHRYASGESLAIYAERMGRSLSGLKVALHRLRNSLSKCIQQRLETRGISS
ncbi:sigma-70 family RNA polymerase sigma factor [Thalassoglobus sp. JC818]|uniref:sigma-70 family RNA polymerase sigma factor n=1 Tax=Thalassoglobus sp. JC818 TaxID=3232136 RepID=UPI0034576B76